MIQTFHYANLERIDYKFSQYEIREALLIANKIEYHPPNDTLEFEIYEDSDGSSCAKLSVIKETKKEKP